MTGRMTNFSKWVSLLLILATITAGIPSAAYSLQGIRQRAWTTVGSAGTVDVPDLPFVAFDGPVASLIANAPDYSSVDIRYNVLPVEGLYRFPDPTWARYSLDVRYRDEVNAASAIKKAPEITVLVMLKSMKLSTGAVTTLLTFNSNDFAAAPGFQRQHSQSDFFIFEFNENAYWIEAQLTHGRVSMLGYGQQPAPAPAALAAVHIEPVFSNVIAIPE